jgi:hypothetical protein
MGAAVDVPKAIAMKSGNIMERNRECRMMSISGAMRRRREDVSRSSVV